MKPTFDITVAPISLQSHRLVLEFEHVLQAGQSLIYKAEELYQHGYTTIDHCYTIASNILVAAEI